MAENNGIRVLAWWSDENKWYQFVTHDDYYAIRYQYRPIELSERGGETSWRYVGSWISTDEHGDVSV